MSEALDKLSPREREVLALVAKGMPNKAIARELVPPCAEDTVKEYLKRVYVKLGAKNRAEAAAIWAGEMAPLGDT